MVSFSITNEYMKYRGKNIRMLIWTANKYSRKNKNKRFYISTSEKAQFTGGHFFDGANAVKYANLGLAVGDINAAMNAKITKKGKQYTAKLEYYLIDCYKTLNQNLGFVSAKQLHYLMTVGCAKPYRYRGYETITITWKQGSKNYSIVPKPQPTPNI